MAIIFQQKQNGSKKAAQNVVESRCSYGACYLLDQIGIQLGLIDNLQACFPYDYHKILSLAYYMVLESESTLEYFEIPGDSLRVGELLPSQIEIYDALGVKHPA